MGSMTGARGGRRPIAEVVAAHVRRLRNDKGISVVTLARRCGCAPELIDTIEAAAVPELSLAVLEVLASALEVAIEDLVSRRL
jgi:transcriptional regulator with XRE-family HTH domain